VLHQIFIHMFTKHFLNRFNQIPNYAFLKVLLGDAIADQRGKSGGMVYQKGRYGLIKRVKSTPTNPQSTYQQNARANFTANSQAWRSLTDAQRLTWSNSVGNFQITDVFGRHYSLSGSALYNRINNNIVNAGGTVITSAPTPIAVAEAVIGTLTCAAGTPAFTVAFTPTPVATGFTMFIYASAQYGAGKTFVKNKMRLLTTVAAAGSSPANILSAWNTRFGTLVAGNKIRVSVVLVSKTTGQMGIPTSSVVTVAA